MTAAKSTPQAFAFPASFAQERLWLLANLDPNDPAYHVAAAVDFKGVLKASALRSALAEVVRRHESLRTTFRAAQGKVLQIVSAATKIDLEVIPFQSSNGNGNQPALVRQISQIVEQPFDLISGPLLRAVLLKKNDRHHVLVLAIHHIVSDGWSLVVLIRELMELYRSSVSGTAADLPVLPIQYVDYSEWQRKSLSQERLDSELAYWKDKLDGIPVLDLPTDYNRPAVQRHSGARQRLRLSDSISAALTELSKRQQASLFMVFFAAFKVLLHRYAGSQDIVVGTPVAGRNRPELENLIGCFLNTLVLRTQIPENATFLEVLRSVRDVALDAYSHEDTPFEKVLETVNPRRTLSHTPLFQVFVNMLPVPEPLLFKLPGLTAEVLDVPETTSKFDFTLYIYSAQGKTDFSLVYNTDLFTHERMSEMLHQFACLLEQIAENPAAPITHYSLVTKAAQNILPDPGMALDKKWEGAVHELFHASSEHHPHQLAVADPHLAWTYKQLEALSNRLANCLVAHGVKPQDVVAIYAHRSAPLVLSLLGIMKAGAAFLILDPAYPAARLVDYLEIAEPKALLHLEAAGEVPPHLRELLERFSCPILSLPHSGTSDFGSFLDQYSSAAPAIRVGADDLAYISFTSGSTGKPKGVLGRHGPLTHFLPWWVETFSFSESDRFSLFSALSHDPLHRDVFTPLMIGAAVLIPPEDWQMPGKGAGWMRENRISISNLTPALGQVLTQGKAEGGVDSLRCVFFVGDALTRREIAEIRQMAPQTKCINFYGATETQRAVSFFPVSSSDIASAVPPLAKDIVPLGHGIKDVQLLVLNSARQLAGIGEPGEIYFRSPHMAKGYRNDPKLSDQKFIANWFTGAEGDRLYRTGDLGRYLPDGSVESLGRADTQVKIRGFRVETGEIEAVLKTHPLVKAAAVLPWPDSDGNKHLVAYIILERNEADWEHALFEFLAKKLPDYMLPASFVSLLALPLTPNGKLDRRALPAPDFPSREQRTEFVAPRDPEEELLCGIFAQVLKRERVGVDWNFFQMGGHSLLATHVIGRIRMELRADLPLRSLFEFPTVAALARQVRAARGEHPVLKLPIEAVNRDEGDLPLSFAQQRLWFLDQLQPGNAAYNMPFAVRLTGRLHMGALRQSFNHIVQRHEILRTTFPERNGVAVQKIGPAQLDLEQIDIQHSDAKAAEQEMQRYRRHEAEAPFNLQKGPLLRVKLLRLQAEESVLLVTMHHIVSDGWSLDLLVHEFGQLYTSYTQDQKPLLPDLQIQYGDYTMWQRRWLQGEVLEEQVGYWRKELASLPVLELPSDHKRQSALSNRGAAIPVNFSPELTGQIKAFSRQEGVTLFMTLLGAWHLLLSLYSTQEDIAVGSPIAGRNRPEIEPLIGFFVNTLVLRVQVHQASSFRQLLRLVREKTLEAYEHQDVPFEKLVDELQPERDLGRQPFFQVVFGLQNTAQEQLQLPRLQVALLEREDDLLATKFDLTLLVAETERGIEGRLEYVRDLFERTTVEGVVRRWQMVLDQVIKNPNQPVARISLLTAAEQQALFSTWKAPQADYAQEESICSLIAQHAKLRPDAIALVSDGRQMSYGEFNQNSNQWAYYLSKQQIRPGDRVAVCLEPGVDCAVISLAVMKSGAVLVGLETEEPPLRISRMLGDSRPMLLLTTKSFTRRFPVEVKTLFVEEHWAQAVRQSDADPQLEIDGASPACVLYRSSAAGRPLGVVISHLTLCASALMQGKDAQGESERVAHRLGFNREVESLEWWRMLAAGACVISLAGKLAPRKVATLLRDSKVTVLWTSASMLERLAREFPWALKTVGNIFCEEQIPFQARFRDALPPTLWERIYSVFGYGETGGCWMKYPLTAISGSALQGHLAGGTHMGLLDTELNPVPDGFIGEICLGGQLADGYYQNPQLTAAAWIPDPFSTGYGARLYRTGIQGWKRADGSLDFSVSSGECLVVNGFRIEAREIEAALAEHPGVKESAVVLRQLPRESSPNIAAVIVPAEEGVVKEELQEFLSGRLPAVMLPQEFIQIKAIEHNGKGLDRRSMLHMVELREAAAAMPQFEAPHTEVERILASIWQEVLGVETVGLHDNFFNLGGDSILSIQVIARAKQSGLALQPRQIFENQTIAELSVVAGRVAPQLEPEQGMVSGSVPLAPFQARFFQWELKVPQHFNQSVLLQLDSSVDTELLEEAVAGLVEHHDALRMRYELGSDGWRQIGQAEIPAGLYERKDFSGLNEHEQKERFEQDAARVQGSLDLYQGRLAKVVEYDFGSENGRRLLLVIHHLAVDGISWRIMLEDLEQAYQQREKGQEITLPLKTISFKQWAEHLRKAADQEQIQEEVQYWTKQWPINRTRLPRDYAANEAGNLFATQDKVIVTLDEEATRLLLHEVPGIYNTQINDVLLTVLGRVMTQWTGLEEILVDLEGHGREGLFGEVDVSRTVGWFSDTYPVVLKSANTQLWNPVPALIAVKEHLRAVPNRGFGYGLLHHMSSNPDIRRSLEEAPQAEIIFNYFGQMDQLVRQSRWFLPLENNGGSTIAGENHRPYVLDVNAMVAQDRLLIHWTYSKKLHRRETIQNIADHYVDGLRQLIASCLNDGSGGFTPSDFTADHLTQEELLQIAALLDG
ncbi:MAG TPA: amino acid adenylation domain-containing protein [Candidatus Angelobacter sp.]|nr:amino acid adenylation domain-containing protein [Candidatus Angelobacter sp.]